MKNARDIINRFILDWKVFLLFTMIGIVLVCGEVIAGRELVMVAKHVPCTVKSIDQYGTVKVMCGGSEDSFTDQKTAIALLLKPQPLTCSLHRVKGDANCHFPGQKKS